MSRKCSLVIAAFVLIAVSAACTQSDLRPASQATVQNATRSTPSPVELFAQLIDLDQHAIARAEQAQSKNIDEPLRTLAENMQMHHRRNLTQTRAVADSAGVHVAETPAMRNRRAENARKHEDLAAHDGESYSQAYLAAVVETHEEALALVDTYLQSTDDEAIRSHLERTRGNFAEHLEAARALLDG
jgi:predicted outer membrane protein